MEYKVLLCCLKKALKALFWTYLIRNMQSLGREEPTKVSMCPHGQKHDLIKPILVDSPT
jgi:hypothetical protein